MLTIYQEDMPDGHVVALASGTGQPVDAELARALRVACQSGQRTVLIDCRLLDSLPLVSARRLWAFHLRQLRRGGRLVLCHVSEAVGRMLREAAAHAAPALRIASSLDEGARLAALG